VQMLCNEGHTANGSQMISPEAMNIMKTTFFNPFAKMKFQNDLTNYIGSGMLSFLPMRSFSRCRDWISARSLWQSLLCGGKFVW
jgi:hypothetical protein